MDNRQIALKLMLDSLGIDPRIETTDDRKRVQKAIYLGQLSGIDLGYRFSWYLMGPYSPSLTRDYYGMAEEIEAGDRSWERKLLKPSVRDTLNSIRAFLSPPSHLTIDRSDWLELIASYHFLRSVSRRTHSQVEDVFARQKPKLLPYLNEARAAFEQMPKR